MTASFEPASVSSSPAPPRKSKISAIAGGVIGGILVAVAFSVALLCLRKRRRTPDTAHPILREDIDYPDTDWTTSQLEYDPMTGQLIPATADLTDPETSPSWLRSNFSSPNNMPFTHEQAGGSSRSAKSGLITLSYTEPTTSNRESVNSQSNLMASVDAISRLNPTTRQREAIMTSLASNVGFPSSNPTLTPMPMAEMQETASSRMSGESRNEASELTAVLSSISRLSENERSALVSMLNSMTRPVPSAGLTGEHPAFMAPPPYGG